MVLCDTKRFNQKTCFEVHKCGNSVEESRKYIHTVIVSSKCNDACVGCTREMSQIPLHITTGNNENISVGTSLPGEVAGHDDDLSFYPCSFVSESDPLFRNQAG